MSDDSVRWIWTPSRTANSGIDLMSKLPTATLFLGVPLLLLSMNASAAPPRSVKAADFTQESIYHAPEKPGYSAWCTVWRDKGGDLRLAFQQVTGPAADPAKRK